MTRNVFPTPTCPLIFSQNAGRRKPISDKGTLCWGESLNRTLRWGGVLNMRALVGRDCLHVLFADWLAAACVVRKDQRAGGGWEKHCVS